jgi:glutamine cyclotransferase
MKSIHIFTGIQTLSGLILGLVVAFSLNTCHNRVAAQQTEFADVPTYVINLRRTLPHDPHNFTQGLLYYQGYLYESTGLYGHSSLQQIEVSTGRVIKKRSLPGMFGEGLARWDDRLVQLTWRSKTALIYDLTDFTPLDTFQYATEGWGLTTDGRQFIMSDGSDTLYFRNAETFAVERTVRVTLQGRPIDRLNELEYVNGSVYANVWYEDVILQIHPTSGEVVGLIDATPLLAELPPLGRDNVLNGIAYNPDARTFYLTGKRWPAIFEVTFVRGF